MGNCRVLVRVGLFCAVVAGIAACGGGKGGGMDAGSDGATPGTDGGGMEAAAMDAPAADAEPASCRADSDCDDGVYCNGAEQCLPSDPRADAHGCVPGTPVDCDDGVACTLDSCSEMLRACHHTPPDNDGDGHGDANCLDAMGNPLGDDCDDNDANRYPGNTEVCDHHDEDCNPDTLGFLDADGDGASSSACCNGTNCGPDCNDSDATIHPGAADGPPSACDNVDNDCSGVADEGCPCVEGLMRPCGTPPELGHVGECRPGQQFCVAGAWTSTCTGDAPPQSEVCDGLDNDCDGTADNGVKLTYYRDGDGDGFGVIPTGAAGETTQACSPPDGYVADHTDCDDAASSVNPGAPEVCNGVDDNCNAMVDEGLLQTYYRDADGDGFGDSTMSMQACYRPMGYVTDLTDCDDTSASVHPGASDVCNGIDDDCDGTIDNGCTCVDGTTRSCGPAAVGICAPGTQRCIGGVWAECVGDVTAQAEVCNGLDDDCNGTVDNGVKTRFYRDADGDGFGTSTMTIMACSQPAGYSALSTDCNDSDGAINPAAVERCDGIDNNCDGMTDPGCACTDGDTQPCGMNSTGACRMGTQECVGGAWGTCVGNVNPTPEVCNGIDDDCNGTVDNGVTVTCYVDADSDGYGAGTAVQRCPDTSRTTFGNCPSGYSNVAGDCVDSNATVHPGASESCNGVDDNCNGTVDEGVRHTYYRDADGDGFGAMAMTMSACSAPAGYVAVGSDCNDSNASINPAATEVCDSGSVDENCNGSVNEGCACTNGTTRPCGMSSTGACRMGTEQCVAGAWGTCVGNVDPTPETCNGIDDDCNGTVDNGVTVSCYADADGDGYGTGAAVTRCPDSSRSAYGNCPTGYTNVNTDCNDANATVHPGATETCNGVDDNCNSTTDEGLTASGCYRDLDGDTYGTGSATTQCRDASRSAAGYCPTGYYNRAGDCDDTDAFTHPGASERCNGIDDNCNGTVDEGVKITYYLDSDHDGYGSSTSMSACSAPANYVAVGGDCNDSNASVHPGATELCNGVDDDCTGGVDNGAAAQCPGNYPLATNVASWSCGTGTCTANCSGTYASCDGTFANGCETDLSTDIHHCGSCAVDCGTGGVCSGSGPYTCDYVTSVWAGANDTCARRSSGRVACWGRGYAGELADPSLTDSNVPVWMDDLYGIDRGDYGASPVLSTQGCAVSGGRVYCWGNNAAGQVGDGTALTPRPTPALVYTGSTVTALGLGYNHSCVRSSTSVYCWGDNYDGQLGLDIATYPYLYGNSAHSVPGSYYDLSAGDYFTCGLSSGPTVKCWGLQTGGRLGNGTTAFGRINTPQTVSFPVGFSPSDVECGISHCCAIGTYSGASRTYCWGSNSHGELGNGGTTDTGTPQLVSGGHTFVALALGDHHSCGLETGGSGLVYCWGYNYYGQLGIGNNTEQHAPSWVFISNVISLTAGNNHTCAVNNGHDVYCWGSNSDGQLGDGTNTSRNSPTAVANL